MDYCIDLSEPTINGVGWATLPKESALWRVHREDAGLKPRRGALSPTNSRPITLKRPASIFKRLLL